MQTFSLFWFFLTIKLVSSANLNPFRDLTRPAFIWEQHFVNPDYDQLEYYRNSYAHSLGFEANFYSRNQPSLVRSRPSLRRQENFASIYSFSGSSDPDSQYSYTRRPILRTSSEEDSEANEPGVYHIPGLYTTTIGRELIEVKATEIPWTIPEPYDNPNPNLKVHVVELKNVDIDLDDVTLVSFLPVENRDRFEVFGHREPRPRRERVTFY